MGFVTLYYDFIADNLAQVRPKITVRGKNKCIYGKDNNYSK